jgi:hypothetical protein
MPAPAGGLRQGRVIGVVSIRDLLGTAIRLAGPS